ncbi:MAG: glucose-6-phosphate dehydrogenase [Chlorobium sp.]|nr:MAG: glucose-6-phosphate dehydrogenase [Chlorobium sp.]
MQVKPSNCTIVIFGAGSDLASRKLFPALYDLAAWGHLPHDYLILGVGRAPVSDEAFRLQVKNKLAMFSPESQQHGDFSAAFFERLRYVNADFMKADDYILLQQKLGEIAREKYEAANVLFYLSTPPGLAPVIVRNLEHAGLGGIESDAGGWRKIVIEKPYGTDLDTARELNVVVGDVFREEQVFRIDHYLGKETVQNILVFRFSNGIFEPLWNRHFIANVSITISEDFGIRDRGAFYEETGLLRDIFQNHALQLIAAVAMEPPVDLSANAVRDEKAKLLRSIRRFDPENTSKSLVLGQYEGYRSEKNVAPDSMVETFAAVKMYIDNWRWKDVPFFIKAGKNLAETMTEIVVTFNCPPQNYFGPAESCSYTANQVIFRIQPEETISIRFGAKRPGEALITDPVYMKFDYRSSFSEKGLTAYHRLLLDAIEGEQMNFIRQDSVEYSWAIVDALRAAAGGKPPEPYPVHSRGPESAADLYG